MIKVLIINPWAVNNDGYYARGFLSGMYKKADITFATNYYFENENNRADADIKRIFFKKSEKMNRGALRKAIRAQEYVSAYQKILHMLKENEYDIVHIHWLLFYDVDVFFLKLMRKYTKKIILTAHNILPHCNGEKYIPSLYKIYGIVDTVLVHGEALKKEFGMYFPQYINKVKVQYHGVYLNQDTNCNENNIPNEVKKKVVKYSNGLIFTMIGAQFYNKGTDRLLKSWLELKSITGEALLVVAGAKSGAYPELDDMSKKIKNEDNVLLLDYYVDNNMANYLLNNTDCVIIPYRHASMSGVVFTAAEFSKTVVCTDTGALTEYLENGADSFVCENSYKSLTRCLENIICNYGKKDLYNFGIKLKDNIKRKYSWDVICDSIIREVYNGDNI